MNHKTKSKMKKDILFLCQFTYPEYVSSAVLPFDTATHLVKHGFSVDILSGFPKEYFEGGSVPSKEIVDGVSIKRIPYVQMARSSRIGRLVNYFSFTISAFFHLPMLRKYRSVIVYSNPPILPIIAVLGNVFFGIKILFVAYDVYPEIAYASKSLKPGSVIDRAMKRLNRALFRRASRVIALTDEMKSFLSKIRPQIDADRTVVISNWAHEDVSETTPEDYVRFGYTEGQFIVSYFGNMGVCQDMKTLMDAAFLLKDHQKIRFLIVGHGSKMDYVRTSIKENNLKNVQSLDFLTGEHFSQAMAVSSCCVVSLEEGLKGTSAPSKYYSYLKAGKPVLTITEEGSYLQVETISEGIGYSVANGESMKLANLIERMNSDPGRTREMGKKAHHLYKHSYEMSIGLRKYVDVFDEVIPRLQGSRISSS